MPPRDHAHVGARRGQVAVGLADEPAENLHCRVVIGGFEQFAGAHVRVGEEGGGHVHPPAVAVFVQPPNDVHGLQRQAELAPQRHHALPLVTQPGEPEHEQFGQQMPHASGHLVHVVVQIRLGMKDRPPKRPARHPGARSANVAYQDLARGGRQPVQSVKHGRRVARDQGVGCVLPGLPKAPDQGFAVPTPVEDAPPFFQQGHLLILAEFLVVLEIVGYAKEQVGDGDLAA